jgi:hypothetical protein
LARVDQAEGSNWTRVPKVRCLRTEVVAVTVLNASGTRFDHAGRSIGLHNWGDAPPGFWRCSLESVIERAAPFHTSHRDRENTDRRWATEDQENTLSEEFRRAFKFGVRDGSGADRRGVLVERRQSQRR